LTAGRLIEPFTSVADCHPFGLQFAVKSNKRVLQAAERAEKKLLMMSGNERIKALGATNTPEGKLNPKVVLKPLSPGHSTNVGVTDDSMTDVEPDTDTQTEMTPISNTESKKTVRARKKAPMQACGGQKKEVMKQLKKANKKSLVEKRNYSITNANERVSADGTSNSQEHVDEPQMVANSVAANEAEQSPKESILTAKKSKIGSAVVRRTIERGIDNPQAADVNGLPATVAKAKHETPKSVARKRKSEKSADVRAVEKTDDTESLEKIQDAADSVNVSPASLIKAEAVKISNENKNTVAKSEAVSASSSTGDKGNKDRPQSARSHSATHDVSAKRKRKAGSIHEDDADEQTAEHSSNFNVLDSKQQDIRSISPSKSQKIQQFYGGESLAVIDEAVHVNVTSTSIIPQQMTSNLKLDGGIRKRGCSAIRRQYANVGNRVLPAADFQHLVPEGGFSMLRGRGRGRPRGPGSTGFNGVHQGMGVPRGPCGARGAISTRRVQQRGMPVRGRGRVHVVGGPPHCPTEMMLMRNGTSGSGDNQVNAASHSGASVRNVSNATSDDQGECLTCYIVLYFIHSSVHLFVIYC